MISTTTPVSGRRRSSLASLTRASLLIGLTLLLPCLMLGCASRPPLDKLPETTYERPLDESETSAIRDILLNSYNIDEHLR